ncbi:MAG TPA: helix-turn-helix domain-containing protein [Macromonas sp.]|nr:helix-turn-helix domain-containing protein [Macromonas sp.]
MRLNHSLHQYGDLDQNSYRSRYRSSVCAIGCETVQGIDLASVRLHVAPIGSIDILKIEECGIIRGWRNPGQIREDKIDDFLVVFPQSVPVQLTQAGRTATVVPGTMALITTDKPFEGVCASHNYAEISVRLSGAALRKRISHIDECCVIPVHTQHGAGRVLRTLIETLLDESQTQRTHDLTGFDEVVLGSVDHLIRTTQQLADLQDQRLPSAHARVYAQARQYIEDNLSHPKLGPTRVAEHCRISPSYLHAAFAVHGHSVGDCIRQQRVERIRDAMGNPLLDHRTLTELAMQWGFNSYAAFSRAFQAHVGSAPQLMRTQLQAQRPGGLRPR